MQNTSEHLQPQQDPSPKKEGRFQYIDKLRAPGFGYLAAVLFVSGLLALEKLDEYVPQAPLFLGAPFGLIAILVALIWGIGPALVAFVLGLIVIAQVISPGIFSPDVLKDSAIVGPFIILEIIAIAVVVRLEKERKALFRAKQELEKEHERVLQSHNQLEQANALKDYVLTRAAHELRTPLTTILGRTQLLSARLEKSGQTPENWAAVEKYIAVVEIRALHLRALLESLFELSRAQNEAWPTPLPPCDLKSLCRDAIEELITQTECVIRLDFPGNAIEVPADDKRLFQALANVLANAVKYSKANTPIDVHVISNHEYVTLRIHNECDEISPEQLERLFQPFYRTPNVEYSSMHGWGLGLAISKEIIERHRGQIWAESSQVGDLSVFIRLPLHTNHG